VALWRDGDTARAQSAAISLDRRLLWTPAMPPPALRASLIGAALFAAGCTIPAPTVPVLGRRSPYTGYASNLYGQASMWLCRPDFPDDVCHRDATATEVHPNLSRTVARSAPAAHPPVDCFYVYPTVDMKILPGNHTDTQDSRAAAEATVAQVAPFQQVCELYVPLYRQVTFGTYVFGGKGEEARSEVAYSDVEDAFLHYMGQYNHGRKVVLLGHSQGADMIVRLLKSRFENDPVMRSRLLVAMPIGGPVEVPKDGVVGGTFSTLPLCTKPDELGCIIAYQSRPSGGKVGKPAFEPQPGNEIACVNPALPSGRGASWFARSLFPITALTRPWLHGVEGIETPFLLLRNFYTGACTEGPNGYRYLAVAAAPGADDARQSALDLAAGQFNGLLGLHVADFQFAMGDLIDLVARRTASVH
jgi:Protein of unknown function (DUF3089)